MTTSPTTPRHRLRLCSCADDGRADDGRTDWVADHRHADRQRCALAGSHGVGSAAHASHGGCRRGRGGRLRDGLGRAVDVELRVVPAGRMRDYRAEQRGLGKFSEHTTHARRHGAGGTGRPVVHRQNNEHVRPLLLLLVVQPAVSADSCRDLSAQNLTGQMPATITRLRLLSSMCARRLVADPVVAAA